jgi:Zn ribbon nucleic-acid-binding protein
MQYDPFRVCSKCGQSNASTQFVTENGVGIIKRNCIRCGYVWIEKPLDEPEPQAKEE